MTGQLTATAAGLFEDEHDDFRASVRGYFERELAPARGQWRERGIPRELFRSLGELGFVAMAVPEELGGAGIDDHRFNAVVIEEAMSAGLAGLALMLSAHSDVCVPLLVAHAHDDERAPRLAGLANGELIAAWAPGDGLALEDGRLNGPCNGVVGGGLADVVVTAVRAGEQVSLVAVDADAAGVSRQPSDELIGPFGCDRADLRFDGAEAIVCAPLADPSAPAVAERLSLAVAALAGARAALDVTLAYVQERRAFGQLIATFENTRVALASVAAELDATESFVYACIGKHVSGRLTPRDAAAAKLRATGLFARAADQGVQLHGGYGYMYEYEIAHAYTAARYLRLHGGADQALTDTIAESLGL